MKTFLLSTQGQQSQLLVFLFLTYILKYLVLFQKIVILLQSVVLVLILVHLSHVYMEEV